MTIQIDNTYVLTLLTHVEVADLQFLHAKGRGVYICNYPENLWYSRNGMDQDFNFSVEKKMRMFRSMTANSILLSATYVNRRPELRKGGVYGKRIHLGRKNIGNRLSHVVQICFACLLLLKWRKYIDYVLFYNYNLQYFITAPVLKLFSNIEIMVDFEDDYLLRKRSVSYWVSFHLTKHLASLNICINDHMRKYFDRSSTIVHNGFIDLSYLKKPVRHSIDSGACIRFLFSGTLDEIRGADLLERVAEAFDKRFKDYKIFITGGGELSSYVMDLSKRRPQVVFLGFLGSDKYLELIKSIDYCLVLQKPDHPFTLGSFPSKVEYYAKAQKPILQLQCLHS